MINLPYITLDQLVKWKPRWLHNPDGMERAQRYADQLGGRANALDILRISDIPADDRLWVVLREEMIPATILHGFGVWCADQALSLIDDPDPRSVNAVAIKRRWMRGEATDDELRTAQAAAWAAAHNAALDAVQAAAQAAAHNAAWAAARVAAREDTWSTAQDTAWAAAWAAAQDATWATAQATAQAATRETQVQHLIDVLEEA